MVPSVSIQSQTLFGIDICWKQTSSKRKEDGKNISPSTQDQEKKALRYRCDGIIVLDCYFTEKTMFSRISACFSASFCVVNQ